VEEQVTRGARCGLRGAGIAVRGTRYEVRVAGTAVRDARYGVRGAGIAVRDARYAETGACAVMQARVSRCGAHVLRLHLIRNP